MYASLSWITPNSDVHTDNLCCQDFEGKNNTLSKKIGGFPENGLEYSLCDFQYSFLAVCWIQCFKMGKCISES